MNFKTYFFRLLNIAGIFCIWLLFVNHSQFPLKNIEIQTKVIDQKNRTVPPFSNPLIALDSLEQTQWVDSIMSQMSIPEKISQLMMVAVYSNRNEAFENEIESLITNQKIGGLIFMQGTPLKQATLTNRYQAISKTPLLIGFDGEWGLNMRLENTYQFPWNMALGAIQNPKLIEDLGKRIGEQCNRMGIHINFAPVVDINTNPLNPIIGNRSYGSDKINVTQKAEAFTRGMQSESVMACAKHFPGHGDTSKDSHKTLPVVLLEKERLHDVELFPYQKLIAANVAAVMTAHLDVPSLDNNNLPASLSENIVTNLLQKDLQFKGLIFTDALNMKGALDIANPGKLELMAFLAGNDILLFPENVQAAVDSIYSAYTKGQFGIERLDHSVRKVLQAKYKVHLNRYQPIELSHLNDDLNTLQDTLLHRKLVENSITLIQNRGAYPIEDLTQKIAYVKLGDDNSDTFYQYLTKYAPVTRLDSLQLDNVSLYDLVIIGYHKSSEHPWKQFKLSDSEINIIQQISSKTKTILSIFTSPYSLLQLDDFQSINSIVVAYQNHEIVQQITAQKLFGASPTRGILPVALNNSFPYGIGYQSPALGRLSYGYPEEVGMNSLQLAKIDSVAHYIIQDKMAPGMQILVARKGKVIYQKSFGTFTYDNPQPVTEESLYDLASVTKILGALPLIMKSYEDGNFTLEDPLGKLFPYLKNTNKEKLTLKETLSHTAGLQAWIPFYKSTLDSISQMPLPEFYSITSSDKYSVKVSENLYALTGIQDTIFKSIANSELLDRKVYRYSDLFFTLFKDYVSRTYRRPMDQLNDSLYYKTIGAYHITYNPLQKFGKEQIVPTENDQYFRHQLLQGYVHDMSAAMLGGVSGHAGLFGNANDVAKMMQMYLQNGFYGGKQYFKKSTIETFNHRYFSNFGNRRGLGFDKPQIKDKEKATCGCVSDSSFGHSGFTGIYTWADPESEILYVFLSNRVYPTMDNNKLVNANIRTEIQKIIQDALTKP